ncbi:MAG TPA: GlsB/YeaQ/YmgE family stress response membrane protein [Roseiflexaceae bacterium]|nr:GlsB/YeaQ/YmgE family stress response membrane protein [Roseiflexaceae bacterium]
MDLLQLSILLIIAGICAAIAQWVVGFSPGGFMISIIVGVVGAYLGTSLASFVAIPPLLPIHVGTVSFDLLWAVLGSLLLLLMLYLVRYGGGPRLSTRR